MVFKIVDLSCEVFTLSLSQIQKMRFLFFLVVAFSISCSPSNKELKEEMNNNLKTLNTGFYQGKPDTALLNTFSSKVESFVEDFPQDTLAAHYLFELGLLQQKEGNYEKAVTALQKVYDDYPESPRSKQAMFYAGVICANDLKQYDRAKEIFTAYLNKFSSDTSYLTRSVQLELQHLGKTPEEILKEIERSVSEDTLQKPV